jgi:hypothetical protein
MGSRRGREATRRNLWGRKEVWVGPSCDSEWAARLSPLSSRSTTLD